MLCHLKALTHGPWWLVSPRNSGLYFSLGAGGGDRGRKRQRPHIAPRNEEKCSVLYCYAICYVKTAYLPIALLKDYLIQITLYVCVRVCIWWKDWQPYMGRCGWQSDTNMREDPRSVDDQHNISPPEFSE